MKKILIFISFLICISCNYNENFNVENDVTVKLASTFSELEVPLSRANNNGLYGIQVYRNDIGLLASKDDPLSIGIPICYGVFDNINDIEIVLSKKYSYNIEVTYIPNGDDIIYKYPSGCYELPFNETNWTPTKINTVYYSEVNYLYGLDFLNVNSYDNTDRLYGYYRDNIDYYYGCVLNFIPSDNAIISVNLKNMIWGLTLEANNTELSDIENIFIIIDSNSDAQKIIEMPISKDNVISELIIPKILLINNAYYYYFDENYSLPINIAIGTSIGSSDIASGKINLKRNVMKIIKFNANKNNISNGITIDIDNDENKMDTEINNL